MDFCPPITSIGSMLERDLLMARMNRTNDYSKENLTIVLYLQIMNVNVPNEISHVPFMTEVNLMK